MTIGHVFPAEWTTVADAQTGREIRRYTSAAANSYPLYYFIPSVTPDGRFLVFHSERTGWVQLFRLDLDSGAITQLTDGHTRDAGWAIWCEHHLRGIYNHLSALNGPRREVYYFQDQELRCTQVDTLANRRVVELPGRIPVGQTGFSPDGRLFAWIHAERELFKRAIADREALHHMGQAFRSPHEAWRTSVPTTISVIDTQTGACRDVADLDFHVHHVFFVDNTRVLINHLRGGNGMWTIDLDGGTVRTLRPPDAHGTVCHQVLTERGLHYEANGTEDGRKVVWLGRYDLQQDAWEEACLPELGYVHVGYDPAGRFLCIENQGRQHELLSVHYPRRAEGPQLRRLRTLSPIPAGQRYHAHPFLSPDRRRLFYTEVIDGFAQVCSLDVSDLVDLDEYWERHSPP